MEYITPLKYGDDEFIEAVKRDNYIFIDKLEAILKEYDVWYQRTEISNICIDVSVSEELLRSYEIKAGYGE